MDETKSSTLNRQVTKDIQHIINLYMDLSAKLGPLDTDLNELTAQIHASRQEINKLQAEKDELIAHNGDYISRVEGIKAIEKESTARLERIETTRNESIALREQLAKEQQKLDEDMLENKKLVEIIEINTNPIHFYVRGLQELFDSRGIKISVIEELRKINKRPF